MDEPRVTLLESTIRFWQPYTSRPLTQEDARQAVENVVGFFTTLQRWSTVAETPGANSRKEKEAA